MQSANIDANNKIIGLMNFDCPHFTTVPDDAMIGDYFINNTLYPSQGKYKVPKITDGVVSWVDDIQAIAKDKIPEIDAQIKSLEDGQTRQLREIAIGLDDGTAKTKLQEANSQIAALRTQRAIYAAQLQ